MSEVFRDVPGQATWLKISEKSVRRHAARMGAVKVGSRLLFPESATLHWLESQGLGPRRRVRAVR